MDHRGGEIGRPRPRAKHGKIFLPGEPVPETGIYEVIHDRAHRTAHEVVMHGQDLFPACDQCDARVRFKLIRTKGDHEGKRYQAKRLLFRRRAVIKTAIIATRATADKIIRDSRIARYGSTWANCERPDGRINDPNAADAYVDTPKHGHAIPILRSVCVPWFN